MGDDFDGPTELDVVLAVTFRINFHDGESDCARYDIVLFPAPALVSNLQREVSRKNPDATSIEIACASVVRPDLSKPF